MTTASESFESKKAPEPVGKYPHARRVGNMLYLSGVGPRQRGSKKIPGVELDEQGNIVSYDIETQCRSVFANVRAILEDTLLEVMYELPSRTDVVECIVDRDTVAERTPPTLITEDEARRSA